MKLLLDQSLTHKLPDTLAENVRGKNLVEWWPVVNQLEDAGSRQELEALLCEMRDAAEQSAKVAGWTVVPLPAYKLAQLYEKNGDADRAIAELRRFDNAVRKYRKVEPTGGDKGHRRAIEYLDQLEKRS